MRECGRTRLRRVALLVTVALALLALYRVGWHLGSAWMACLLPAVVLCGTVFALELCHRKRRVVTQSQSVADILELAVRPWMLAGWDGTRAVVFHPRSGLMVQAVKRLSPRRSMHGQPSLVLQKTSVADSPRYDMVRGRFVRLHDGHPCRVRWFRELPSPYEAAVIEESEYGALIDDLVEAARRMLCEKSLAAPDEPFYVWCEQGTTSYVMGRFEGNVEYKGKAYAWPSGSMGLPAARGA